MQKKPNKFGTLETEYIHVLIPKGTKTETLKVIADFQSKWRTERALPKVSHNKQMNIGNQYNGSNEIALANEYGLSPAHIDKIIKTQMAIKADNIRNNL